MKRLTALFTLIIVLASLTVSATAVDNIADYTIYYEDGSYAVVTLAQSNARSTTNEKKIYTYYNSLGQRCFAYGLSADFTYNGITSSADSCHYAVDIYRQGWDIDTHSEYVSGSTAYGSAAFTGPDGQTRTASLTLTCDKNGNVA